MKYEEAIKQLDEIVQKMENDEYDIDQLGEQMKKARELIKMCKDKLTKTDEEVQRMLKDE
jgi:exodeoxyribonuclease VII small subunit